MPYLYAFLAALVIDSLPAFAPPAWTALIYLQLRYGLSVWPAALIGTLGSTVGRYILTCYIHRAARLILSRHEARNMEFLGQAMGRAPRKDFAFVFLYSLTPLSTSPLFMAAGMADLKARFIFPPFALGKLLGYAAILYTGEKSAGGIENMLHGRFTWQSALIPLVGVLMIVAMLFIDWRALLHDGKLRLHVGALRPRPKHPAHLPHAAR